MRVGDPGNPDSFLVVAATFLIGVAFGLSSFAPALNPMEKRAAEDRRARNSTGFGLYECGFYSSAVSNAHRRLQKRAILVVVENSDPIPFHTDPRLVPWARSGVSFPLAVRVSDDLSAELSAMGTGFGIPTDELQRRIGYPKTPPYSVEGWKHGSLRVCHDLDVMDFSAVPCESGYVGCGGTMTFGAQSESRPLSVDLLRDRIRRGGFNAGLTYLEYTKSEANTIDLLAELHDALVRGEDWQEMLVAVAALPPAKPAETSSAPTGSQPFSLFIKFPGGKFAGRTSSLTVSSYDLGNTLRQHFDSQIAMDSLPMLLRNESRHRSRFVFGGEKGKGLTWVRAGRFEYDIGSGQVFDVDADERREHDISDLAQNFEKQARQIVENWPRAIDHSLFDRGPKYIEDIWASDVTPIDPFAGSPTHFIYK